MDKLTKKYLEEKRQVIAQQGLNIHLSILDFILHGPNAKINIARKKTNELEKILNDFKKKALKNGLFVVAEQFDMFEDFRISILATADAEISYEEHTLVVAEEVYLGR